MVQISNVYDRTIALLASQFRDQKPDGGLSNFQKLIKILSTPAQELQDVLWELKTERWLSSAVGEQLDLIGQILGLPRNQGESDEDYRERLEFQVFINLSSGTPEQIIEATQTLTESSYVRFFDVFPAFFQLEIDSQEDTLPSPVNDLNEAIFNISSAGVNYAPITTTYKSSQPFLLSGDLISQAFSVVPSIGEQNNLLVMPYNKLLFLSAGNSTNQYGDGGLDELDHPQENAGTLSELIQKNGNLIPNR